MEEKRPEAYKSAMTKGETIAALAYLPVHIVLLPSLLYLLLQRGYISESQMNLLCYAVGTAYMLALCFGFLRRDFDPLCDRLWHCLGQIALSYAMMLGFTLLAGGIIQMFAAGENPNNEAVMDMAALDRGSITAMAVYLAPIVEELMFRGGIFGLARRYNRIAAYALSMLAFSLYHVWAYALLDPTYWLYLLQYLPVSFLLCRLYERTETIWSCIFFHMLINAVSLSALSALEGLL